ncbi:nudix hydrolase 8 [Lingula anatina]|uniref:Nucleoside diphosphate-linked moiety X motif 6 n=1 Tax=Lingula anatina TaxID=7574 RepID=A0A1S3I2N1_LINAN|nr:nudix hydrolase 8 [Lingula anatina]|eukprot:XP_013391604.1 nudix hydrolase 8 [Lingula anatina]
MADCHPNTLPAMRDRYDGVIIDINKQTYETEEDFEKKLVNSLCSWSKEAVRGVWVKIPLDMATLVPICAKHKFVYNHAKPSYVMMTRWLPQDEENCIPPYANQYLGCAGFVVNSEKKLLVIQEKYHVQKMWKLPGGLADTGEDIGEAAEREVFEETGVRCKFQSIICFRHMHKFRHGLDDFYFICLMEPMSKEITKCDREISACCWMDLDEYINHPDVSHTNKMFAECYLNMIARKEKLSIQPTVVPHFSGTKNDLLYSMLPFPDTSSSSSSSQEQKQ